jgi:hypothetical protein
MILRVSLKHLREGHTQSCYLPPHELRLLDWIPGFTSEPNIGHLSLASPPQNHIQLHQPTPVDQWKTSNIFKRTTSDM